MSWITPAQPIHWVRSSASLEEVITLQLASGATQLNLPITQAGKLWKITFILKQPASGAAGTVTWNPTPSWYGGPPPSLSSTNNDIDIVHCVSTDGGQTWVGWSEQRRLQLLTEKIYNPTVATNVTNNTTVWTDVDAANAITSSFFLPPDGKCIVEVTGWFFVTSGYQANIGEMISCLETSSGVSTQAVYAAWAPTANTEVSVPTTIRLPFTGNGNAAAQFKLQQRVSNATGVPANACGIGYGSSSAQSGPYGPLIMRVWGD